MSINACLTGGNADGQSAYSIYPRMGTPVLTIDRKSESILETVIAYICFLKL